VKITRVGRTSEGGSEFSELDVELIDAGEIGRLSDPIAATGAIFRETEPTYDYDWHCAPQRQFLVMLDGVIEVEVTSGEKRTFSGGDVLLLEDITGSGHRTRALNDAVRRSIFITLPEPN
jgi:hypothetical protein